MKQVALSFLLGLALVTPVLARDHGHRHHRRAIARHVTNGMPITAASDSIRINAVGEVISQPGPVIQKDRRFNAKSRRELSGARDQPPAQP